MAISWIPEILLFIQSNGYLIFFIAMVIEGPVVNTAAAFAASLGYFNICIIFLIAILGDLIGDLIYFFIGRFSRTFILDEYGHHVGLSKKRISYIEKNLHNHFMKTLLFVKLTPFIVGPGLTIIGASKVKLSKFIFSSLIITIPTCIFFTLTGYYFGMAVDKFMKIFNNISIIIIAIILLIVVIPYLYKLIASRIAKSFN